MIRAILWDNDGILVDTERLYFRATRQILGTVGVNLTETMYFDLFLVQAKGAWHLAEANGISFARIEQLRAERHALYLKFLQTESMVIPGVEEVLKTLYGKYVMGVVTSSLREHFDAIHRRSRLMKYFAFTLTAEDYTKFKPDPEPYLAAVKRTGFSGEECIAIEDSERGLNAAVNAGLKCIVIPTDLTQSASFRGAYKILNNVREIPSLLSSI